MQISRALTASILMALLFVSGAFAVEYDFILNESSRSYRASFSPTERAYMDGYMAQLASNFEDFTQIWPNRSAIVHSNSPPLGKPHVDAYALGLGVGIGLPTGTYPQQKPSEVSNPDQTVFMGHLNKVGLRILDHGAGAGQTLSLFATVSPAKIWPSLERGFWRETDLTLTYFHLLPPIFAEDVVLHLSHTGLMGRKQILSGRSVVGELVEFSGASLSAGMVYATFSGQEGIPNAFNDDTDRDLAIADVVLVDERSNGTVTVGSPAADDIESMVDYDFVYMNNLTMYANIKGHMSLFHFLDIFAGTGLMVNPVNHMYLDLSSETSVRLSDDGGLDSSYDGKLTAKGTSSGRAFIPTFIFGLQLNLGPVKLAFQAADGSSAGSRASNLALYVSL